MLTAKISMQGLALLVDYAEGDSSPIHTLFSAYLESAFPYLEKQKSSNDVEMKKVMEREIAKGMLTFKPLPDLLAKREQAMRVPEELKEAARRVRAKRGNG